MNSQQKIIVIYEIYTLNFQLTFVINSKLELSRSPQNNVRHGQPYINELFDAFAINATKDAR